MWCNERNVRNFTDSVYELLSQNINLVKTLEIIAGAESKKSAVREGGCQILENLRNGMSFSAGLRKCSYIHFDDAYISFVNLSERTGNLVQTMNFLYKKYVRRKENQERLSEVMIYPCFVILIAFAAAFFLVFYVLSGKITFLTDLKLDKRMFVEGIAKALFFLVCYSLVAFSFIRKCLCENKMQEAFIAMDFLVGEGFCISEAAGEAVKIAGINSSEGQFFSEMKIKMEYGMSLNQVMKETKVLKKGRLEEALFFAEKTGNEGMIFSRITDYLACEQEKIRKNCLSLVEPLFILAAGIFLMILAVNVVLPVMKVMYGGI